MQPCAEVDQISEVRARSAVYRSPRRRNQDQNVLHSDFAYSPSSVRIDVVFRQSSSVSGPQPSRSSFRSKPAWKRQSTPRWCIKPPCDILPHNLFRVSSECDIFCYMSSGHPLFRSRLFEFSPIFVGLNICHRNALLCPCRLFHIRLIAAFGNQFHGDMTS
jgi:hypothetical protein